MRYGLLNVGALYLGMTLHGAAAEPDRDLAKCADEKDSVKRLACFDTLATDRGVSAPKADLATKGNWEVVTETSKIDDSTNVRISVQSSNTFPGRLSRETNGLFMINCQEKETDLFVYLGGLFLSDTSGFGQVTYRIDKRKANTLNFTESTNHEALGLWSGSGIRFVKELFGARNLLLRVTPFNESAVTIEFDVTGLEEAIKPLRKACAW